MALSCMKVSPKISTSFDKKKMWEGLKNFIFDLSVVCYILPPKCSKVKLNL